MEKAFPYRLTREPTFQKKVKRPLHNRTSSTLISQGNTRMKDFKHGIEEYKELVKKKYSIEITQGEAEQQFMDLLALFQVIYRPIESFDRNDSSEYNQGGKGNERR